MKNVTLTTPSVDPVIITFNESHSRVCENATHKICCILSALPTQVSTEPNTSPFIDHTCNHVPAHVAISPCKFNDCMIISGCLN